jgi:hypothetical protein
VRQVTSADIAELSASDEIQTEKFYLNLQMGPLDDATSRPLSALSLRGQCIVDQGTTSNLLTSYCSVVDSGTTSSPGSDLFAN